MRKGVIAQPGCHYELDCEQENITATTIGRPHIRQLLDNSGAQSTHRSPNTMLAEFTGINLYTAHNAMLTREFICYDENFVYLNPSFLLSGGISKASPNWESCFNDYVSAANSVTDGIVEDFADLDVFVAHHEGGGTWGHYLVQSLPRIVHAKKVRPNLKVALPAPLLAASTPWRQLLDLAGLTDIDFVGIRRDKTYRFRSISFCDYLWDFKTDLPHPAALDTFNMIGCNAGKAQSADKECSLVFLERDPKYGRSIENIDDIKKVCEHLGFSFFTPARMDTGSQVRLFRSAAVIVGTLGSDLSGIVFARAGAEIVSLSPVAHGDSFFFNLASVCGLGWSEILSRDITSTHAVRRKSSFRIDPTVLNVVINKALEVSSLHK